MRPFFPQSRPNPVDIEQAHRLVLARARALEAEPVGLAEALGRVLAADACASEPVPAFDNSAMDGFAVRAADTKGATPQAPAVLRIVGESRAGAPAGASIGPGEAVRISTGAMLPAGADAVVRIEDARDGAERLEAPAAVPPGRDGGEHVEALAAVPPGRDVRRVGEDIKPGARVIASGTVLGAAELGVLASLDQDVVACTRRPRVAVVTTGDELLGPGEPRRAGGVRNTNLYTISALVERWGGQVAARLTAGDDLAGTREALAAAIGARAHSDDATGDPAGDDGAGEHTTGNDVVVVCGGVSVGRHDHVRAALAALGANEVFWRVALRPGGPAWFGTGPGGALIFGLPGNPVSAMVTFLLLVRPALRAVLGAEQGSERTEAVLDEDYAKQPGRAHAVRCRLALGEDGWHARPTGPQGSHILTSMLNADALALIPTQSAVVRAGERVEIELVGRG